jgi:transcriptional regulator PpsR
MDAPRNATDKRTRFRDAEHFLSGLGPGVIGRLVEAAADVALLIRGGVVSDISISSAELSREGFESSWRGQRWVDTVTAESRNKIEEILRDSSEDAIRWRHVNHPSRTALDVPVRYAAVPTGTPDQILVLGRDLRSISTLQQRLVEAHQELERDYSRLREAEARYRLLFDTAAEPVFVLRAGNLQIEEANPAVARLVGREPAALIGTSLLDLFAADHRVLLQTEAAQALGSGYARLHGAVLAAGTTADLSFSAFRKNNEVRLILRLIQPVMGASDVREEARLAFLRALEHLPDGLVVTDTDLRIVLANAAFVSMTQAAGATQITGAPLGDFLGRSSTELNVLVSSLRTHGSVRNFASVVRDRFGSEDPAEISAVLAPSPQGPTYGFSVRGVARRLPSGPDLGQQLPNTVGQLTSLVGKVALRDIVRDSTDLIERLCIEAALQLTDDNRASAAEILGLSRQGLYSKLKRFGIDDKHSSAEE